MDTFSGSIRCGPRRSGVIVALALMALGVIDNAAFAAESTNAQSFRLSGSATIKADQPTQQSGSLKLKAYLAPKDVALAVSSPVQEGNGFALIAKLGVVPLVCYNDTIFRDDFDGNGQ